MNKPNILKMACALAFCVATAVTLPAQTFTTLVNFDEFIGFDPQVPPIEGVDGNFYGTTFRVGSSGAGIIFRMTPEGDLTTLYTFCSKPQCTDGQYPLDALVEGSQGDFYGTTIGGGQYGRGTVFRFDPEGGLNTLHSFCPEVKCADGGDPAQILQGRDGNLYGITLTGGANDAGTIFKLTPRGVLTTLHDFCSLPGCADGYNVDESLGTLIEGTDGNFYGTTDIGGSQANYCDVYGCGTVFKITPQGKFTTIYRFCSRAGCADGAGPYQLTQGADGYFYGVTGTGGSYSVVGGTIFRLSAKGKLTTLYSFCAQSDCPDGREPISLAQPVGGGNFYGTTFYGGTSSNCYTGCGTVFEITTTGAMTSLESFDGANGNQPYGLAQAPSGIFYGVTSSGGAHTYGGTVYSMAAGLTPFVEIQPTGGSVGTEVIILGTNLESATAVTFNGSPATFTVVSSFQIRATVPKGATTGLVKVKTPASTLSSNVVFQVK
jgi:uncharacterized repeat protein (TIGR03803 family)